MPSIDSATNGLANPGTAKAEQSLTTLANNFGSFLKLLTTQLQNQDPLSPMETHEFTNQLVMFAEAEQAIATNQKLDSLIKINQNAEASQALNYHGRQVRVKGNKLSFMGEPVSFGYTMPKGATNASMIIRDKDGKEVFARQLSSGQVQEGEHILSWDGRNEYGYQLAEGLYTVTVSAKAVDGEAVKVSNQTVTASVRGVEYVDGKTWLDTGYYQVELDNVAAITTQPSKVEDQVRALNYVGHQVMVTGNTAPIQNGEVSLAYNTFNTGNLNTALKDETLDQVSLKFLDQNGKLVKEVDVTGHLDASKLAGGDRVLDLRVPGLSNGNYRVEMAVSFKAADGNDGSTFNNVPMGYSGKVRRVVFDNSKIFLEINGVLYDPRDVGSVLDKNAAKTYKFTL